MTTTGTGADEYGLRGKVAIVSGGGGPLARSAEEHVTNGRAAALLLARAGARVCVVGRTPELAQATVDMIVAEGGDGFALCADITEERACRTVVDSVMDRYDRLDCLDNNVGITVPGDVTSISLDDWHAVFAVNLHATMLMCRAAIPAMIEGGGGTIVNISSLRSIRPQASTVYTVTKGAVNALTQSLAVDHGPQGIRANGIILGPVFTPMVAPNVTPEQRRMRVEASLMKREGTGWDTGYLVRFLLSDQSAFITGQNICLDGGASVVGPKR
jgi:NAD(P)-dependent dehydrogenase (short-subunit alcohol dehydrogenase family)